MNSPAGPDIGRVWITRNGTGCPTPGSWAPPLDHPAVSSRTVSSSTGGRRFRDPGVQSGQSDAPLVFRTPSQYDLKIRVEDVEGALGGLGSEASLMMAVLHDRLVLDRLQAQRGQAVGGRVQSKGQHADFARRERPQLRSSQEREDPKVRARVSKQQRYAAFELAERS